MFPSETELSVLMLSSRVAAVATVAALLIAVPMAWLLARRDFRGKVAIEAVGTLPLVLPPVVTGYLLLILVGSSSPVGRLLEALDIQLAFTALGAAIASAVVGFPLAVRAIRQAIESVDPGLEEAARTLGASPFETFRQVTLPLALPGVVTGGLLCFARALGEFGATITFAGNIPGASRTLTLAIWSAIQTPGAEDTAARLAVFSILLAVGALLVSAWLSRRLARRLAA